MSKNNQEALILWGFSMLPYLAIAWFAANFIEEKPEEIWKMLGLLLGARFFFSLIEWLGSVLSWRMYGKKATAQKYQAFLSSKKFPAREGNEDLDSYLYRILFVDESPAPLRENAWILSTELQAANANGLMAGLRLNSAANAALDAYSPKAS